MTTQLTRRAVLPVTEEASREAADEQDARRPRCGFSPSYRINLGGLSNGRYVGYGEIFPRTLYHFREVHPVTANESEKRIDEEVGASQPTLVTISRQPRTCAEDVRSEADDRVFVVFNSLVDNPRADEVWDAIYPVEAEADVWAMTDRRLRQPEPPDYLRQFYERSGLSRPFVTEGHALVRFIEVLEKDSPGRIVKAFAGDEAMIETAEYALREAQLGALEAYRHRYARLHATFGSMESRRTGGKGKLRLTEHDHLCIAETGIKQAEVMQAEATQQQANQIGEKIAEGQERAAGNMTAVVETLAAGQKQTSDMMAVLLEQNRRQGAAIEILLREREQQQQQQQPQGGGQ